MKGALVLYECGWCGYIPLRRLYMLHFVTHTVIECVAYVHLPLSPSMVLPMKPVSSVFSLGSVLLHVGPKLWAVSDDYAVECVSLSACLLLLFLSC